MKYLKLIFKVILFGILFLPVLAIFLVRFTDLTISVGRGKALLGYNEATGEWVVKDWEIRQLTGADGPYIFKQEDGYSTINVKAENGGFVIGKSQSRIDSQQVFLSHPEDSSLPPIEFTIDLKPYEKDSTVYAQPHKLIAISDIEGNLNGFIGFLQSHGVIDKKYNWTFGKGHLVLVGDLVDRGPEVTQVLWLIYKMDQESKRVGGKVHFIVGNHDALYLQGNPHYVHNKYKALAQQLFKEPDYNQTYKNLVTENSEIVRWMKSKNVILKIGKNLFVHGGISPELVTSGLTLPEINEITMNHITESLYNKKEGDANTLLLAGSRGPLWFRGMVAKYGDYEKVTDEFFDSVLTQYGVQKIIIGHSYVDQISTDYDGKLIRLNVLHGKEMHTGETKGILMEGRDVFSIDDKGGKEMLK